MTDYGEACTSPELTTTRQNHEYFIKGQIVALCNAGIGNYISVLAAARELNRLGFELFEKLDNEFRVFAGICSETEDLPVGIERQNWDPKALLDKDGEVRRMEAVYADAFKDGCEKLLQRFGPSRFI